MELIGRKNSTRVRETETTGGVYVAHVFGSQFVVPHGINTVVMGRIARPDSGSHGTLVVESLPLVVTGPFAGTPTVLLD